MATAQASPKRSVAPISTLERWRAKTNCHAKRPQPFAPLFPAAVAEIGRLVGSKASCQIMYIFYFSALGKMVKQDEEFNTVTEMHTSEIADLVPCDVRTVQRELADLARRGVIEWEQLKGKKGVNRVGLPWRTWASLPDYKPGPVAEPELPSDDEPVPEDPAQQNSKTETLVTRKPVHVGAGQVSKEFKVDTGVKALQVQTGELDTKFSAVVRSGVLVVTLAQKWQARNGVNGLLQQKDLDAVPRQGCRINSPNVRQSKTVAEKRTEGETLAASRHPRADELEKLFDPLVMRWCGKAVSNHPATVDLACNAIAEVPHDYLVKLAVDRASREIKSPKHVVMICRDIKRDWEKWKGLPADQRKVPRKVPTREEIDALIAKERAAKRSA